MANIEDVFGGIKSRVDDNPLTSGATSVTVQNEFTGLDVGVPGYLTIGDPQDALPGANGEVPASEFVRYESFSRNGDGTSTFSGLTRGLRNSTAQEWTQGTIIGVSIPGALLERLPTQKEDFSLGGNAVKDVSTLTADNIILQGEYGVEWDQSVSSPDLTRLGSAQGLSAGAAFDSIYPWGGMQRVNLADDGTVNAVYGDADYAEDGSNGQVMVEIPKFYYKTSKDGTTYQFWISPVNKDGYSLHPAFLRGGQIRDYIYVGAYEATVYDSSAGSYVGDGITYDYANDIMASVANLQPISGNSDHLDILEARQLASNRGSGWAQNDFFNMTAWQLLAVVEYASFDFQSVLSEGITNLDGGSGNHSQNTGHTSSLGNSSGEVVISTLENGATGATETYACSYRGIENPYGNIWNFTDGIFVKDDGYYIESDPSNWNSDGAGYTHIPTTPINGDGYINDIDYLTELDYHFFASSTGGSSSTYLCDYQWSHDSGEVNILRLGGGWNNGSAAGLFCSYLNRDVGNSGRAFGSRLEFVG